MTSSFLPPQLSDEHLDQLLHAAYATKVIPSRDLTAGILERAVDARFQQEMDRVFKRALALGTLLGIAVFSCGVSVWQLIARWIQGDVSTFISEASIDLGVIIERVGVTPIALLLSLTFAVWASWKLTSLTVRKDLYVS